MQPTTNFNLEEESKRKEEWDEIENLVLDFQKQFTEDSTKEEKEYAKDNTFGIYVCRAGIDIVQRFLG